MPITIRHFEPDRGDTLPLVELFKEMQAYYKAPCPPHDELVEGLLNRPENSEFLLAVEGETVLGFAAYTALYPGPYVQPGIFLKELYVGNSYRGKKIGEKLMRELSKLAIARGLKRIDWTADGEDARLLKFYDGLGGDRRPEKLFYRLTGADLEALASTDKPD